jgi:hypothetical protein
MRRARCRHLLAVATLASLLACVPISTAVPDEPRKPEPAVRLAVLVVFDQLRGDYLTSWDDLFGEGGFHRLEKEGIWFQNCQYPYAATYTGPGHASLATGAFPHGHGIIFNEWYDRKEGGEVYCASNVRYQRVPPLSKDDGEPKDASKEKENERTKLYGQGAPVRLLAPTLADALKEATRGQARVVSVSMKDRSAILLGGQSPNSCYWFDSATGTFVTSTYYCDALHPWVDRYNATKPVDAWFGKPWTHLRADLDYVKRGGPEEVPGAGTGYRQGKSFPHAMDGGLKMPGKVYYDAVYTSPFGNEVLLGFVKKALDAEGLGTRNVPDLLCVSFSCNDSVGHVWGPDSQEVLDTTLRTDALLKDLLDTLDAKVGKGKYIVALSSDHGVCPLPEVAAMEGKDARRSIPVDLRKAADEFLEKTFPRQAASRPIKVLLNDAFYLNADWVKTQGVAPGKIEQALADWLKMRPGVQTAYTRSQLSKGLAQDDEIGQLAMRSFHPERSGDVLMIPKPYWITSWTRLTGTTHGSPHPYDRHVPLLVYGPGLVPGVRMDRVTPQANVPILAKALGIAPPAKCNCPLPGKVFK